MTFEDYIRDYTNFTFRVMPSYFYVTGGHPEIMGVLHNTLTPSEKFKNEAIRAANSGTRFVLYLPAPVYHDHMEMVIIYHVGAPGGSEFFNFKIWWKESLLSFKSKIFNKEGLLNDTYKKIVLSIDNKRRKKDGS